MSATEPPPSRRQRCSRAAGEANVDGFEPRHRVARRDGIERRGRDVGRNVEDALVVQDGCAGGRQIESAAQLCGRDAAAGAAAGLARRRGGRIDRKLRRGRHAATGGQRRRGRRVGRAWIAEDLFPHEHCDQATNDHSTDNPQRIEAVRVRGRRSRRSGLRRAIESAGLGLGARLMNARGGGHDHRQQHARERRPGHVSTEPPAATHSPGQFGCKFADDRRLADAAPWQNFVGRPAQFDFSMG